MSASLTGFVFHLFFPVKFLSTFKAILCNFFSCKELLAGWTTVYSCISCVALYFRLFSAGFPSLGLNGSILLLLPLSKVNPYLSNGTLCIGGTSSHSLHPRLSCHSYRISGIFFYIFHHPQSCNPLSFPLIPLCIAVVRPLIP